MKKLLFLLFLIFTTQINAQELRKNIKGIILNDSLSVNNIHIINKNIKIGVATNKTGKFIIPVKLNDTLIFSSIQFKHKIIVIKKKDLAKNNVISIDLEPQTIQLAEVEIFLHKMIGNLAIDGSKLNNESILNLNYLDYSGVNFDNIISNDSYRMINLRKKTLDLKPNSNYISGGADVFKIIKLLKGKQKVNYNKASKKEKGQLLKKVLMTVEKIRIEVGDVFFTKTLHIPTTKINNFLYYALDTRLIDLYNSNNEIEVITYFIKVAPNYLKLNN